MGIPIPAGTQIYGQQVAKPATTATPAKTTSAIPQSTLDNVSKQIALITQQVQNIAAQVPSVARTQTQEPDYRSQMSEKEQAIYDKLVENLDKVNSNG